MAAYGRWKNDPNREIVYRQDIFGRFVPDLKRKRIERTLWACVILFYALGAVALWGIMHNPNVSWYDPKTKVYHMVIPPPQKGQ